MKHLIARNLTAWQVVFQSNMAPGSPSLHFSLPFYNGLLEAGVALAATSPHGAIELDLSHESDYPATVEPPPSPMRYVRGSRPPRAPLA